MKFFTKSVELRFSVRTLLLLLLVLALGVTAVAAAEKYQETTPRRLFPDEDLANVESVTLYPINQWSGQQKTRDLTIEETKELLEMLAQIYHYGEAYLCDLEVDGGGIGLYALHFRDGTYVTIDTYMWGYPKEMADCVYALSGAAGQKLYYTCSTSGETGQDSQEYTTWLQLSDLWGRHNRAA